MLSPRFLLRFATSDLKQHFWRFFFIIISFALGMGVFSAVSFLSDELKAQTELQAKSLLGADLLLSASTLISEETLQTLLLPDRSLSNQPHFQPLASSRELSFSTMLGTPVGSTRIVQLRAIQGGYPFYGELEVTPRGVFSQLGMSSDQIAIIDQSLATQYDLDIGASITLGTIPFQVVGILQSFPGENFARSLIAPRVFVPLAAVQNTALTAKGSRLTHNLYLKADASARDRIISNLNNTNLTQHIELDTVERRKERLGNSIENVARYLYIVSFAAVILGCLGMTATTRSYIQKRLPVAATLRCIGATSREVFLLYLVQSLLLALLGGAIGVGFGWLVELALPVVLGEFLPVSIQPELRLLPVLRAFVIGIGVGLFAVIPPLRDLFTVEPFQAVRSELLGEPNGRSATKRIRDGISVNLLFAAAFFALSWQVLQSARFAGYTVLTFTSLIVLFRGVTYLLTQLLTRYRARIASPRTTEQGTNQRRNPQLEGDYSSRPRHARSFSLRYALAALIRPQNQTSTLLLTLGLSTFLLSSIVLIRSTLLSELAFSGDAGRANLVLFDVQPDQVAPVKSLLSSFTLTPLQEVPIVTMRIVDINGRTNASLRKDSEIPDWTLRREYRSTYRSTLIDSETIVEGSWNPAIQGSEAQIPISIEEGLAQNLKIRLGDSILFDVQGLPLRTVVASIRKVNWRRVQTNFFFVFPPTALQDAPQFFALTYHAPDPQISATAQRAVTDAFGNISAIDLTLVLQTAQNLFAKFEAIIRFLALFTLAGGVLVLTSSIVATQSLRIHEMTLLRTLGASRRQLFAITALEFVVLATISVAIGILSSAVALQFLSRFLFSNVAYYPLAEMGFFTLSMVALIVIVGLVGTIRSVSPNTSEAFRM